MTLWNPEYRLKVNGSTVTSVTLAGMTITSGRNDIYSQAQAGYCNLSLLETNLSTVSFEINDAVTVEVKKTDGSYVFLFGGFVTDVAIEVATSGATATSQRIKVVAVGALARLVRAIYNDNLASGFDGDQIYTVLQGVLFDTWNEVPASLTWATYPATTTWANAQNSGLGEIDRPGDYELDSQNNLLNNVYAITTALAQSGLGILREDSQGRIAYDDSTHRTEYFAANGYVDLDGNQAIGPGLSVVKKAGDVRNSVTLTYTSSGNSSYTATDATSTGLYGQLASTINTTLKNAGDATTQANFYLSLRAYPQYQMSQITYEIGSPELDDADRDSLLQIFMGLPLNITNLPANMVGGSFQGFVEGWTWTAGYNKLTLTMILSPISYSLQAFRWSNVPIVEQWTTINPTLTWQNATIVA